MRKLTATLCLAIAVLLGGAGTSSAGNVYKCEARQVQSLSKSGRLENSPFDKMVMERMSPLIFDEATGVLRDGFVTWQMKLVQEGTSENSTVAMRTYKGAGSSGVDVFRIATYKENMPFLYLFTDSLRTGVCERVTIRENRFEANGLVP